MLGLQFIPVVASASGANQLVAGQAGTRIIVKLFKLIPTAEVAIKFQSGSTDLTGTMTVGGANEPVSLEGPYADSGHFITAAGAALNLNLGSAVAVNGYLVVDITPA